jgi:hypothetical protein
MMDDEDEDVVFLCYRLVSLRGEKKFKIVIALFLSNGFESSIAQKNRYNLLSTVTSRASSKILKFENYTQLSVFNAF